MGGEAGRHDPGQPLHLFEERSRHGGPPAFEIDQQHAFRIEAGIEILQIPQRADEQARSGEQHQRQRHLRAHQRPEQPRRRTAGSRVCLEGRGRSCGGRLQRRRDAEQHTGRNRDRAGEAEDVPVGRQIERDLIWPGRNQAEEKATRHPGQPDSDRRADRRQQRAFDQQLTHNPGAAGADRQAHRDLSAARRGARQQQARDIGAGDDQHQPDHRHQHQQRLAVDLSQVGQARAAGSQLKDRIRDGLSPARWPVRRNHRVRDPWPHGVEAGRRLLNRHVRSGPGEDAQPEVAGTQQGCRARADLRKSGRRHGDVGNRPHVGADESARADAGDGHRNAVDLQAPADHFGAAPELPLPVAVADDRHQRRAGGVVLAGEQTPECRGQAQGVEVSRR